VRIGRLGFLKRDAPNCRRSRSDSAPALRFKAVILFAGGLPFGARLHDVGEGGIRLLPHSFQVVSGNRVFHDDQGDLLDSLIFDYFLDRFGKG